MRPGPVRGLPAPRFGLVLLILSLALNAFVAGGFVYSRMASGRYAVLGLAPQPGRKLDALVEQLGLDPETSHPFKEMRRSLRLAQQALAAQNRPLGAAYWEEIAAPQPDQKHLQELLDQMAANRHVFQAEVTGVFTRFMATLTPAQRESLVKIIEDKANPLGAPVRNSVGN